MHFREFDVYQRPATYRPNRRANGNQFDSSSLYVQVATVLSPKPEMNCKSLTEVIEIIALANHPIQMINKLSMPCSQSMGPPKVNKYPGHQNADSLHVYTERPLQTSSSMSWVSAIYLNSGPKEKCQDKVMIYARKTAAMAARPAAMKEPPKVLAAPVNGVIGEPVGVGPVTLL